MQEVLLTSRPMTKIVDFDQHRDTLRYKVHIVRTKDDLRREMARILSNNVGIFKGTEASRFVTFGSCFANNVADHLRGRGASVFTTFVTEDVNSPSNNVLLLRKVFNGVDSPFTDELRDITGVDYSQLCDEFKQADHVIFTLGNIFRLVGDGGCPVISRAGTTLVRESFDETMSAIREILATLNRLKAKIYVSVSPIPISGYRGTEFRTALEADCASKCQLVAAVRSFGGFTYIPTFEIFRWLPAHQEFSTFGEDAQNARHIYRGHIAMVMDLLMGQEAKRA